ncbi:ABC transporter ATP-binding protein [Luteococcus sediminum]
MTLRIDNVTIAYRRRIAVSAVSWRLDAGLHALLGPNGAGKSSLLRAVATLQPVSTGLIEFDGHSGPGIRQHLGYCPQENLGKSSFTVREHLLYMCWLRRIPHGAAASEAERVMELIDLSDRASERISKLSGGMRRRVAIGSALVGDPGLVLLDEPSAGLDMAQRDALSRILQGVARQSVVIVSTHLVEDVIHHADSLAVMDQGEFLFADDFNQFATSRELGPVRDRYLELVGR